MTKAEQQTLRNIIKRLESPNCGCCNDFDLAKLVVALNAKKVEAVSRIYLDTWIIPPLKMLLPGEDRNPDLAESMSRQ